jgi:cyclin A
VSDLRKYEEICAPQVEEFCYITDNTYCREEVLEMERRVLNELKFELTTPTTKSFLRRFIRAAQATYKAPTLVLEFLGNFLAELTLLEYGFLPYLPSMIAASSVYLAKITLDSSVCPWDATLQHYTGYKPSELENCVKAIHELQLNTKSCTLPAIREKYRQHKVSLLSESLGTSFCYHFAYDICIKGLRIELVLMFSYVLLAVLVPPAVLPQEYFKDLE